MGQIVPDIPGCISSIVIPASAFTGRCYTWPGTGLRRDDAVIPGYTLKRMRRLSGMKQSHVAELMGVTQSTVSRWESGLLPMTGEQGKALQTLFTMRPSSSQDAALKRLVESSPASVHLICDATHRLLAVSTKRARHWRGGVPAFLGKSLIVYAAPRILAAEESLPDLGWFDGALSSLRFDTDANADPELPIEAGPMMWERIPLSDGSMGRLVTSFD